jgi:hypothetical protein
MIVRGENRLSKTDFGINIVIVSGTLIASLKGCKIPIYPTIWPLGICTYPKPYAQIELRRLHQPMQKLIKLI